MLVILPWTQSKSKKKSGDLKALFRLQAHYFQIDFKKMGKNVCFFVNEIQTLFSNTNVHLDNAAKSKVQRRTAYGLILNTFSWYF